jgi:hypothetical protein
MDVVLRPQESWLYNPEEQLLDSVMNNIKLLKYLYLQLLEFAEAVPSKKGLTYLNKTQGNWHNVVTLFPILVEYQNTNDNSYFNLLKANVDL